MEGRECGEARVRVGEELRVRGEGGVEDNGLDAEFARHKGGAEIAAQGGLGVEHVADVAGTAEGQRPIVRTEIDVAQAASQLHLRTAAQTAPGQEVTRGHHEFVLQPRTGEVEVAEGMVMGYLAALRGVVGVRQVVSAHPFRPGVGGEKLADAAVGPEREVLGAEAEEVVVVHAAGEGRAEELVLVLHLFPAAPAHAVARHEADFGGQAAAEGAVVYVGIDVDIEVGFPVERVDEPAQVFGVAVGGDEIGEEHFGGIRN